MSKTRVFKGGGTFNNQRLSTPSEKLFPGFFTLTIDQDLIELDHKLGNIYYFTKDELIRLEAIRNTALGDSVTRIHHNLSFYPKKIFFSGTPTNVLLGALEEVGFSDPEYQTSQEALDKIYKLRTKPFSFVKDREIRTILILALINLIFVAILYLLMT